MKIRIVLAFTLLLLVAGCKTTDFTVIDSSYQQWYDGRGTINGINFYISLKAQKKIKNLKFTSIDVNNYHLNPIPVKDKKRVTEIPVLEKNDTIRMAAPLVLKGKRPQITDSTTVVLTYERNKKVYQITIGHLTRKKKLFYP